MKKIIISLDSNSVQQAIDELERYKRDLIRKTELLRQRIGTVIAWSASQGFSTSLVDDVLNGEKRFANVDVSVNEEGDTTVVIASGNDAVFVEFGAGVYNNGSVGTSPHPKGAELGFTIGSFGKGNGRKDVWGYYGEGGLTLTHGTPASMPMYRGMREACDRIAEIAGEVFRS